MNTRLRTMKQTDMLKLCTVLLLSIFSYQPLGAQICIDNSADDKQGDQNGFHYELWDQDKKGTACMTLGAVNAAFSGNWSGIVNYLARRGFHYNDSQLPASYGSFVANYDCTYTPNSSAGSSYLGVYGWLYDPSSKYLVEYYIIDNWVNYNPGRDMSATKKGTFHCDGADYDVFQLTHNGPSIINGINSFQQYVSVRKNIRSKGDISISNHFREWDKLGMKMANLHEASMLVEGYEANGNGSGTFAFSSLFIGVYNDLAQTVDITQNSYTVKVGEATPYIDYTWAPANSSLMAYYIESSNPAVAEVGNYHGKYYVVGKATGTATITLYHAGGLTTDQATITVTANSAAQNITFSALGSTGTEQIALSVGGQPYKTYSLTKNFQTYTETVAGTGDVTIEYLNDDGVTGGRDVRLDYITVNGVKRETEAIAVNPSVYQNGTCGGSYSEWLNCNGTINYGPLSTSHTIAIRARGTAGNEHMNLLINGRAVNGGWSLPTTFQIYTVTVTVDGDINVQYDNDYGNNRDIVVDYIKVDNQNPRQAENMQYNTAFFANGRCGGGSYSEWMNCNGVIGFGKTTDNFGRVATQEIEIETVPETISPGIHVYPNPSIGTISIRFDDAVVNANLKIHNALGNVIYTRESIHDNEIQVSDLASGIYIINVHNNGNLHRSKLIVH